ncbi:acetyltransferase [Gracilibacillus salitolerans]|uniref:Acetyltransferase n=1 Tax=Gracilibacillus salitolerans TaxID=2663022 RepID=A0A5Q2TPA1_9BACI|nr:arylamine N-acetyltransferase [Gracilibacillus salitolerans]QGH36616.1 acetyltransferase [Gracilibacillus salitolerans]
MNITSYLERIQVSKTPQVSQSYLEMLQYQQVTRVPFENLDVLRNIPLSLDDTNIYEKIVIRKRGGLCYELNGLFNSFLKQIGFDTHLIAGTIYRGDQWGESDTHAAILVTIHDERYLIDVGFGGNSPRKPIPLTGQQISDVDGFYRVRACPEVEDSFVLEKKERSKWLMLYRFNTKKWSLDNFTFACDQAQYSPQSPFNKGYFLMKVLESGRKTLFDHSLTLVEGFNKTKENITPNRIDQVVQQFFDDPSEDTNQSR